MISTNVEAQSKIAGLWFNDIANDTEAKASFKEYLHNNSRLFDRVLKIIEEKEQALDQKELSLSSYDNPGWSHKQAHINGRRADLAEFKQLFTLG